MNSSNVLPQIGSAIQQGVQNVGSVLGNQKVVPMLPNSPTIGNVVNQVGKNLHTAGSGMGEDVLIRSNLINNPQAQQQYTQFTGKPYIAPTQKEIEQATQDQTNMTTTMGMGAIGGINEVKNAALPEIKAVVGNGAKMIRDMRFEQGTENPSAYKAVAAKALGADAKTATGVKTTPLNAKAEKVPANISQNPRPAKVKVEKPPEMPVGPGKTITKVNLPASVYGAGNEAQVQNTLDHFVPGKTATEQYKNLQPTLDNFGKQIDYAIDSSPKTTDLSTIMSDYDKNLNAAGIYRTSASSKGAVQAAARKYVKDLTGISDDTGVITARSLADSLKAVNKDAGPVFKKIDNGSKLLPQDEAILAARETIRNSLTSMYGGQGGVVDQLLRKQGDLYDAADSLKAGQMAEYKTSLKPSLLQKITSQNPLLTGAEILGGVAAYKGGLPLISSAAGIGMAAASHGINNVADILGYMPKGIAGGTGDQPTSSNSNAYTKYSPDVSGNYTLPTQTDVSNSYMTNAQRQQLETGITPGTPQYIKIEQKYNDDQAKAHAQLPNHTTAFMDNAPTYMQDASQTSKDLQTMPLDLFHSLDTAQKWDAYLSDPHNPYAKQVANLDTLNTDYINAYTAVNGGPPPPSSLISAGQSKEQVQELWGRMVTFIGDTYKNKLPAYLAVATPSGQQTVSGGQAYSPPAQLPQVQNQSVDMSGGNVPMRGAMSGVLPTIQ